MTSSNRRHDRSSFFKYTDIRAAKAILGGGALRWSSPITFNDPFDIPRKADLGFAVDDLIRGCKDELLGMLRDDRTPGSPAFALLKSEMQRRGLQPEQIGGLIDATIRAASTSFEKGLEGFGVLWEDFVPRLRVLCMSEIPDAPSMWAHYADNHRGVVLEFLVSDELDSSWLLAQPVAYRAEPPVLPGVEFWARVLLDHQTAIDWMEFFREYLYTKTLEWANEKEWRTISVAPEGVTTLYWDSGFHANELSSVRFGAGMPDADQDSIVALVGEKYPGAALWKAVADQGARAITFRPVRNAAE